jgi:hypothetical protein
LQRHDLRKREEEELLSELTVLKALQVNPVYIGQISGEALEGLISYMRDALNSENKALARRIIHQFVAKIVIKEKTGTLYYTFPFPDDLYMPSYGKLDLRGRVPLTRHILRFDIPTPPSTESNHRNADKTQRRAEILAMLTQGMSYREIGASLGIHWTRVGQIVKPK